MLKYFEDSVSIYEERANRIQQICKELGMSQIIFTKIFFSYHQQININSCMGWPLA